MGYFDTAPAAKPATTDSNATDWQNYYAQPGGAYPGQGAPDVAYSDYFAQPGIQGFGLPYVNSAPSQAWADYYAQPGTGSPEAFRSPDAWEGYFSDAFQNPSQYSTSYYNATNPSNVGLNSTQGADQLFGIPNYTNGTTPEWQNYFTSNPGANLPSQAYNPNVWAGYFDAKNPNGFNPASYSNLYNTQLADVGTQVDLNSSTIGLDQAMGLTPSVFSSLMQGSGLSSAQFQNLYNNDQNPYFSGTPLAQGFSQAFPTQIAQYTQYKQQAAAQAAAQAQLQQQQAAYNAQQAQRAGWTASYNSLIAQAQQAEQNAALFARTNPGGVLAYQNQAAQFTQQANAYLADLGQPQLPIPQLSGSAGSGFSSAGVGGNLGPGLMNPAVNIPGVTSPAGPITLPKVVNDPTGSTEMFNGVLMPVGGSSSGIHNINQTGSGTTVPSFGTNNVAGSGGPAGAFGNSLKNDPFNALYGAYNTTFVQAGAGGQTAGMGTPPGGPVNPLFGYLGGQGSFGGGLMADTSIVDNPSFAPTWDVSAFGDQGFNDELNSLIPSQADFNALLADSGGNIGTAMQTLAGTMANAAGEPGLQQFFTDQLGDIATQLGMSDIPGGSTLPNNSPLPVDEQPGQIDAAMELANMFPKTDWTQFEQNATPSSNIELQGTMPDGSFGPNGLSFSADQIGTLLNGGSPANQAQFLQDILPGTQDPQTLQGLADMLTNPGAALPSESPSTLGSIADYYAAMQNPSSNYAPAAAGSQQAQQDFMTNVYGPLMTLAQTNPDVANGMMAMAVQEIGSGNTVANYQAVLQMIADQILGWGNASTGNQPIGLDPARIATFLNNGFGRWWGTPLSTQASGNLLSGLSSQNFGLINQAMFGGNGAQGALDMPGTLTLPTGNYSYSPSSGFTQRPGVDVNIGDTVQHGLGGGAITNLVNVPGQTYPEALGSDQGNPMVTQWRNNILQLMNNFSPGAVPSLPTGAF